jgi:molybdopterin-guanine dinucleotide biosynthesis protein A
MAKGLVRGPDGDALVERMLRVLGELGVPAVLVGRHPAYGHLGREAIADEPSGIGPLGGLVSLLRRAGEGQALALACDMPFVSRSLIARLLAAAPAAPVVSPRTGCWEPLCAIYDAPWVLPIAVSRAARGAHSLQGLLDEAGAVELPLEPGESAQLKDWDTPEDIGGLE